MGGIIILLALSIPFLILSDYDWRAVGVFGVAIACALLGFADDYTKIVKRRSLGLRARTKLGVTDRDLARAVVGGARRRPACPTPCACARSTRTIDLGILYPVLIYLVVAGTTSAVNLTDGLDGLAAGCVAIVGLAYIGITFITSGEQRPRPLRGLPGRRLRRLPVVQRVPGHDLHGGHRLARARRRARGARGDDARPRSS